MIYSDCLVAKQSKKSVLNLISVFRWTLCVVSLLVISSEKKSTWLWKPY